MEVRLLLPLILLHVVTMCHIVNSGIQRKKNIGDTQSVSPRPTTMQNITTPQCDNCPKKTEHPTTHRTTVLPTDQTTQGPSPPPKPIKYNVVGESGVCLRIKAIFIIMLNITEIRNITIQPPPITEVSGGCYDDSAVLYLGFPGGDLFLAFKENKTDSLFYLEYIDISIQEEEEDLLYEYMFLKSWITPLGHSFTHKEVILRITSNVSLVLIDVSIQAFTLDFGRGMEFFFGWLFTKILPSIHTVVFLVAFPLNIMAIVIFLVKMKVMKPAVVYMLNLATADTLLVGILPFYIVYRFSGNNWLIGDGMCRYVMSAYYCNMYCSILFMTSISVDRFMAILYPMRSLPWRTVKRAWLVCGVIWVISLASTVPLLIRQQTTIIEERNITCFDTKHLEMSPKDYFNYFPSLLSLFFFLSLGIMTFCYIRIIFHLRTPKSDHKRSRAICLIVIVLCVFVLCFGPASVIDLIYYLTMNTYNDYLSRYLFFVYIFSSSISCINCCLDPLIYFFASSQFQSYINSLLHWKAKNFQQANKIIISTSDDQERPHMDPNSAGPC